MARQCSIEARQHMLLTVPNGDEARMRQNWIQRIYCGRVRRIRVKAVFLVLLWALAVSASSHAVFGYITPGFKILRKLHVDGIPTITLIAFSGPLAGWLADIKLGRHRVLQASLWSMWIGIGGFILVDSYVSQSIAKQVLQPLCGVPIWYGFSGFMANAIQFAIDQMPEASSEEVSAFIHWYVWVTFLGRTLSKALVLLPCSKLSVGINDMDFILLFMLGMLTLGLSAGMLFRNTLTVIPESRNPMKTVIQVLRYSAAHKYPENRSAYTYTDSCIPSRLDMGKDIYGGPFTTEQVEDVKTFIRIICIILTTGAMVIPLELCWKSIRDLTDHFQNISGESRCTKKAYGLPYSQDVLVGLGIPLYELLFYPLTRRWVPKILRREIIAAVLIVFTSLLLLILDSAGHYMHDVPCMFASSQVQNITLPINYLAVDIPFRLLLALIIMLYRIALFEFILAQSPYNMKGFLLGLGYFAIYFGEGIATSIQAGWYYGWKNQYGLTTPSCDFWYYLMVTIIAVLALVLVVLVVRCYQQREREEPNYDRMHVENYYERYSICSASDDYKDSTSVD